MDAILLDRNFNMIKIIDQYESFIWTERYQEYGDFELYLPAVQDIIDAIEPDYYIVNRMSNKAMIIEGVSIESDVEEGAKLKITGRSLESILTRRIIWKNTVLDGPIEEAIKTLLVDNIIEPTNEKRRIDNFVFQNSSDDLSEYTINNQYLGNTLYEVISSICIEYDLGFEIILDAMYNFVFRLYKGKNRTSGNIYGYPPVIFSPKFDNLISSNYVYSNAELKNATLIGGEGEGDQKIFAEYGQVSGIARRETYTNSSSLTQYGYDFELTDDEYNLQLIASGVENLNQNKITQTFEGEMDTTLTFVYGRDFGLGDALHIKNEYNIEAIARVTEFVMSYDSDGYKTYPNFVVLYDRGKVYLNDVGDVTITDPAHGYILRRRANEGLWRSSRT